MNSASPAPTLTGGEALPSMDELARLRRRRKLARKTPEQRRKLLQYQRRHNEKDGRLLYCDYCDLFISSRQKTWGAHLRSARHLDSFRSYYELAAHVESVWMTEIHRGVEQARSREVHRRQQEKAGAGASTPLPPQCVAPGIVVGGAVHSGMRGGVGGGPVPSVAAALRGAPPVVTVGGKVVMPPPVKPRPPAPPS